MNIVEQMDQLKVRTDLTWDEKIGILAVRLKWLEGQIPPPPAPVTHRFETGQYIRTMTIPTGSIFIGRRHLRGHEVHLIKGRATYVTPKGSFEVFAPYSIFTAPGFAMVAYIIEDVVVETWHENREESRNIEELERRDFEDPSICLARGRAAEDRISQFKPMEALA
jgi:hypothetical protein